MREEEENNKYLLGAFQRAKFLQQSLASIDELHLDEEGVEGLRLVVDDICSGLRNFIIIDK